MCNVKSVPLFLCFVASLFLAAYFRAFLLISRGAPETVCEFTRHPRQILRAPNTVTVTYTHKQRHGKPSWLRETQHKSQVTNSTCDDEWQASTSDNGDSLSIWVCYLRSSGGIYHDIGTMLYSSDHYSMRRCIRDSVIGLAGYGASMLVIISETKFASTRIVV